MQQHPFETVLWSTATPNDIARAKIATDFRMVSSAAIANGYAHDSRAHDHPALFIVDMRDDPAGAIAQINRFKQHNPTGRVAVLADEYRRNDLVSAYRAGANACFVKAMSCGGFIKALEMIMLGETVLPPELLPFIGDNEGDHEHPPAPSRAAIAPDAPSPIGLDAVPRLSAREKCILRCVRDGESNKTIARKIDIAEATVKVHVKAILRKIRLSNRTQAAVWAMNNSSLIWSAEDHAPNGEAMAALRPLAAKTQNGSVRSLPSMLGDCPSDVALVDTDARLRRARQRP